MFTPPATYSEVNTITPFHVFVTKTTLMAVTKLNEAVLISFLASVLILYLLKTAENRRFFVCFQEALMGTLADVG